MPVASDSGFIALHRRLQDHWIYDRADWLAAWIDILLSVNWREGKQLVGDQLVTVPRGAMVASERYLAERWSQWGVDTRNRVRRIVGHMEDEGMIERREVNPRITLLSVCNYDSYQIPGPRNNPRATHEPPTNRPRATHELPKDNKGNKGNKKEEQLTALSLQPVEGDHRGGVGNNGKGSTTETELVWDAYLEARDQYHRKREGRTYGRPTLTPERRKLIRQRLKNYPASELVAAVQGIFLSPHNCGQNDRGEEYLGIEIALRVSQERNNVERFARLCRNGGPKKSGAQPQGATHHLGGSDELRRRAEEIDRESQEMNQ